MYTHIYARAHARSLTRSLARSLAHARIHTPCERIYVRDAHVVVVVVVVDSARDDADGDAGTYVRTYRVASCRVYLYGNSERPDAPFSSPECFRAWNA